MNENDFVVAVKQPAIVTGNFAEMREALATMMTAYAGLEVTEYNLPERKKDIATLRKIKTAIEDKRKAVKREYNKPLAAFETECKNLTAVIDKEVDRLNEDCNVFERKRKEEKRKHIEALYAENIGEYSEYLPIEKIMKDRWLNKSCTDNEIIYDIQEQTMQVKSDIGVIRSMCGEWVDECLRAYKGYGNSLVSALNRAKDLESAKKAAEAAVMAAEQETATNTPETPVKPVESHREPDTWTFEVTVDNEEDATFLRNTFSVMDFNYREV